MAQTFNDRDIQLTASPVRLLLLPQSNYIQLTSNYSYFTVANGVPSITQIVITAELFGQLIGTPTFTVISGSTGLTNIVSSAGKTTAVLQYSSLTAETAVIRASLPYLGITYVKEITLGGQLARPNTVVVKPVEVSGTMLLLNWSSNTDADLAGYEVRETDSGWGVNNNYIFKGNATSCFTAPGSINFSKIWYIRAYDTSGIYSATSALITYTTEMPSTIGSISYEYADTSLTNASVTLRWPTVTTTFGLKEYLVSYTNKFLESVEVAIRSTSITLEADWVGDRLFTIKVVDHLGNISAGYSEFITKELPLTVTNLRTQVIDNSVLIYWSLPQKTSLPISHVIIKRSVDTVNSWEEASLIGIKDGEFTNIQELSGGLYKYWIKTVDTDGNESLAAASITVKVSGPSDYIFNAEFNSSFTGIKTNAYLDGLELVLPVSTTETWQQHFTTRSWISPNSQVVAGFPIYAQPGTVTASYEEVFDVGAGLPVILGSSNVTVTFNTLDIVGSCSTGINISVSADGTTYSQASVGTTGFFTNFRFIKVRVEVSQNTPGSLLELTKLNVRVDTKIKTDSGTALLTAADTSGTVVNFQTEFIDVVSINITPAGSVVRIPVYEITDTIVSATYSQLNGIITVTCATPHGLYPGQNVRLATTTGIIPIIVLPVLQRISETVFTVTYTAGSNHSGNLFLYSQGMRVYLLNAAGGRESGRISWTVRGS